MQQFDFGDLTFNALVTLKTEFRHLSDAQIKIGRAMRIMTGNTAGNLDGRMDNFGRRDQPLDVHVTAEAEGIHRSLQESLLSAPVRIVTGRALSRGNGSMDVHPGEGVTIVAAETEPPHRTVPLE